MYLPIYGKFKEANNNSNLLAHFKLFLVISPVRCANYVQLKFANIFKTTSKDTLFEYENRLLKFTFVANKCQKD